MAELIPTNAVLVSPPPPPDLSVVHVLKFIESPFIFLLMDRGTVRTLDCSVLRREPLKPYPCTDDGDCYVAMGSNGLPTDSNGLGRAEGGTCTAGTISG